MTEDQNYTPIVPQAERVAQASARVLSVIEERGTPDQRERIRLSMGGSATPPPAHHPRWSLFAGEALASLAEMVEKLMKEAEPKRGRGRPRKNTEGERT